jgi:hypothetical protein
MLSVKMEDRVLVTRGDLHANEFAVFVIGDMCLSTKETIELYVLLGDKWMDMQS